MKKNLLIITCLLQVLIVFPSVGQKSNYYQKIFSIRDGLPNNDVRWITQDKSGKFPSCQNVNIFTEKQFFRYKFSFRYIFLKNRLLLPGPINLIHMIFAGWIYNHNKSDFQANCKFQLH